MAIRRAARPSQSFTQIRNDVLRDPRLSYRARGLLTAILSYPDDWATSSEALARAGTEGRDAVRTALAELESAGYLRREKAQDERGRWATHSIVYDTPEQAQETLATGDGKPGIGNPATDDGIPVVGNSGPIKNTINKQSSPKGEAAGAAAVDDAPAKEVKPEDAIAKAVYDHAERMVNYMAVRQIAGRAMKMEGSTVEGVTQAMKNLYDLGKPLTLSTVGQQLAGKNASTGRPDDAWAGHWDNQGKW